MIITNFRMAVHNEGRRKEMQLEKSKERGTGLRARLEASCRFGQCQTEFKKKKSVRIKEGNDIYPAQSLSISNDVWLNTNKISL